MVRSPSMHGISSTPGIDEDNIVMVVRALADGLSKTAEAMRFTSMSAVMAPGVGELDVAVASKRYCARSIRCSAR